MIHTNCALAYYYIKPCQIVRTASFPANLQLSTLLTVSECPELVLYSMTVNAAAAGGRGRRTSENI